MLGPEIIFFDIETTQTSSQLLYTTYIQWGKKKAYNQSKMESSIALVMLSLAVEM